jgi:hypothetical protein
LSGNAVAADSAFVGSRPGLTDKIHFEVQRSEDGVKWATTMSGDEARAK